MKPSRKISISRNLTISLIAAIIVITTCFVFLYSYQVAQKEKQRLKQHADEYIHSIASTLEVPLWNLDQENINTICSYYYQNDQIVMLKLVDETGQTLCSEEMKKGNKEAELLTRSKEIIHQGERVGIVTLAISPFRASQFQSKLLKAFLVALFTAIVTLIFFTGFLLKKFLREPMEYLSRIADSYANGDYQPDMGMVTYTEFEPLVSTLVYMGKTIDNQMNQLQKTDDSLRKHRDNLEEMVNQRTLELEHANRDLQKEVHDRKEVEKSLKANEQRLEAILRASPIGIGLVINRTIDWGNQSMYQMLGYERDSLLGQSVRILYETTEEYERIGKTLYPNVAESGTAMVETQFVRRDGTKIDCIISACFLDSDVMEKGLIIAIMDVSKAKTLEAKLRQAKKMEALGTLAGGVAHDLNNILSGIVSYPELLLLEIPGNSPLKKPLLTIQKSGEKAVKIVQDLLTMARRGVVVTEVINLNDIITEQLNSPEMTKLMYFHPEVEIVTKFEANLLNIKGSPTHISKSIMNLVSNAAEAMDNGGTITITTSNIHLDTPVGGYEDIKEGDYVKITIADTGIGMKKNDFEKIFEPFYTKKKMGRSGTGLGMAVVWGTIKDHHGYIDLQSEVDEGTTFKIYIPVTRETVKEETDEGWTTEYLGEGESILVVDDVAEQREIASAILKKLGYSVHTVASGEEAVQYLKRSRVDLVILDMIMAPGMNGLETYLQISKHRPQQKAVIASGFSMTEDVKKLQSLGVSQYIQKPYTLAKIGSAVKSELAS